ncbi:MAG TPA: dTDP-4-dehydrorhamnose reductase [Lachnospiraceae bacterium]|nr:dTDP-4-dehydrorhamnose reductase [Lachnospiraceae bacterium]
MEKKKIIVTGCNGQLGRAISRELAGDDRYELTGCDVTADVKLDITDTDEVMRFVEEISPEAIINCAAYTAVDRQETDSDLSMKINAIGPRNLAIAASRTGAKLVHISTDYVFSGEMSDHPRTEFDPVGPVSVYGRTKLAGEEFVKQFADRYFMIRTAWLYGDGHNFARTMLKLAETHDELTVVDDQLGTPTSAKELARCIHALLPTDNYGLFHGTCEGDTNWADFAERVLRLAGKETVVKHVSTEEYMKNNPGSARRPAYSILDNYMLRLTDAYTFADWETAIEEYFKDGLI